MCVCVFSATSYDGSKGTVINVRNSEAHGLVTNLSNNKACGFLILVVRINEHVGRVTREII